MQLTKGGCFVGLISSLLLIVSSAKAHGTPTGTSVAYLDNAENLVLGTTVGVYALSGGGTWEWTCPDALRDALHLPGEDLDLQMEYVGGKLIVLLDGHMYESAEGLCRWNELGEPVRKVALHAVDGKGGLFTVSPFDAGGVRRSTIALFNEGEWQELFPALPNDFEPRQLAVGGRRAYIAGVQVLETGPQFVTLSSDEASDSWQRIAFDHQVGSLAASSEVPSLAAASVPDTSTSRVYLTEDGGASWAEWMRFEGVVTHLAWNSGRIAAVVDAGEDPSTGLWLSDGARSTALQAWNGLVTCLRWQAGYLAICTPSSTSQIDVALSKDDGATFELLLEGAPAAPAACGMTGSGGADGAVPSGSLEVAGAAGENSVQCGNYSPPPLVPPPVVIYGNVEAGAPKDQGCAFVPSSATESRCPWGAACLVGLMVVTWMRRTAR